MLTKSQRTAVMHDIKQLHISSDPYHISMMSRFDNGDWAEFEIVMSMIGL